MMMGRGMVIMGGMGMGQPGGKPPKPPRRTFPAAGDVVQMELEREGTTIRFQVKDAKSARPRYLGQVTLGPMDVSAVKLFVTNRNGAEAVNVLMRDFTIRAHHINGLGTVVRTVFDNVIYSDPTSIEGGILIVGGPPKPPAIPVQDLPDNVFAGDDKGPKPQDAKAAAATPAAAPAPAAAAPAVAAPAAAPPPAAAPAPAVVMAAPGVVMVAGGPEPAPAACSEPPESWRALARALRHRSRLRRSRKSASRSTRSRASTLNALLRWPAASWVNRTLTSPCPA